MGAFSLIVVINLLNRYVMNNFTEIPYEPPCSVWEIILSLLPHSEHEIVRRFLGESLVEQTSDLHEEIKCLLEIWECVTYEIPRKNLLLDQSAVKERLIREVALLLDVLRDRASQEGKSLEDFLQKHNNKVLDFCASPSTSRPSSARRSTTNSSGRETPIMSVDAQRANIVQSYNHQVESKLKSLQPKMRFLDMRDISSVLRDMLHREVVQLKDDINFLQKCLENPDDEPSLGEIREERNRLESRILHGKEESRLSMSSVSSKSGKIQLAPLPVRTSPTTSANLKQRTSKVESPLVLSQQAVLQPIKLNKAEKLRAM